MNPTALRYAFETEDEQFKIPDVLAINPGDNVQVVRVKIHPRYGRKGLRMRRSNLRCGRQGIS